VPSIAKKIGGAALAPQAWQFWQFRPVPGFAGLANIPPDPLSPESSPRRHGDTEKRKNTEAEEERLTANQRGWNADRARLLFQSVLSGA
jgi:hypothetical protein